METPKARLLADLTITKYDYHSVSPLRPINKTSDNRFNKCHSEKKLFKRCEITSNRLCKRNKRYWINSKTPGAKRSLKFDVSPLKANIKVLKVNNCNTIKQFSPRKENRCKHIIKDKEHSLLPSVDTPQRSTILTNGINSNSILTVIGYGCFGTVIKAKYKDKKVAVKVIRRDSHKCNSLSNELNGVILKHPNIINVIKVVNNLNSRYALVIMELWFTTNMQHLIDCCQSTISFKLKVIYILGLCKALQYCHNNKVIHLDVKPKNILIGKYGLHDSCKICDFGNSLLIDETYHSNQYTYLHRQGTVIYMAPELLCNGLISDKTDIFSLGITMWQLLHEETPYNGEHLHTVVYKVVSQNYRPKSYEAQSEQETIFTELYKLCWSEEPNIRPNLEYIIKVLENLQKY